MKLTETYKAIKGAGFPFPDGPTVHEVKMTGAFIVFGGWIKIIDQTVPSGTRGHEIYCAFGGIGAGGMSSGGQLVLDDGVSWSTFYDTVKSFAYIAFDTATGLGFFDKHSKHLATAMPYTSFDLGMAGGSVKIKS